MLGINKKRKGYGVTVLFSLVCVIVEKMIDLCLSKEWFIGGDRNGERSTRKSN